MVGRPAREVEQLVDRLARDRLAPVGLVRAPGADRFLDLHRPANGIRPRIAAGPPAPGQPASIPEESGAERRGQRDEPADHIRGGRVLVGGRDSGGGRLDRARVGKRGGGRAARLGGPLGRLGSGALALGARRPTLAGVGPGAAAALAGGAAARRIAGRAALPGSRCGARAAGLASAAGAAGVAVVAASRRPRDDGERERTALDREPAPAR